MDRTKPKAFGESQRCKTELQMKEDFSDKVKTSWKLSNFQKFVKFAGGKDLTEVESA